MCTIETGIRIEHILKTGVPVVEAISSSISSAEMSFFSSGSDGNAAAPNTGSTKNSLHAVERLYTYAFLFITLPF